MEQTKTINEVVLERILKNEDSLFLNVVSPIFEGFPWATQLACASTLTSK